MDNTSRKGMKCKKSLKIPNDYQNAYIKEGRTAQWQKQMDKQGNTTK